MTDRLLLCLAIIAVFSASLISLTLAYTDPSDVEALQDLYTALNSPPQLSGWKPGGGDPCEESWIGVSCSGSTVIHIKIDQLQLTGHLGFELPKLYNLKELNLSHNSLSGPIGNVFTGLMNLKEMYDMLLKDLSNNNLTGDLPSSFGSLTNLTRLFLQSNRFTGSVIFLAGLPLTDLNIQDNHFSGVLPKQFQVIHNLWIGGNIFDKGGNYPPWTFPLDTIPNEQNISSPPSTVSSAIESYPSRKVHRKKKKGLGPGGVACMVGGATLVATCAALFIVVRVHQARAKKLRSVENSESLRQSLPMSTARGEKISTVRLCVPLMLFINLIVAYSSAVPEESPAISIRNSPPLIAPSQLPPLCTKIVRVSRRRSFSRKCRIPIGAKLYTVAELQLATNYFSEENLLGEGSLGSVYKAEFPDGQVFAVKNINTVELSLNEEERFLEVIWNAARLRHQNIVQLHGYCIEHGQHLLVYEYIRNVSLYDALHSEGHKTLSWGHRLRIALGTARALSYLHTACMPSFAHSNLKAGNVLLDEDLTPRISDCGLAVLKPLTSNSVKLKEELDAFLQASEMALCDNGYIAPEHEQPGIGNTKGDIYAFGVLLLELLTGRKPFDSSKPRGEPSLVRWASSRLHDNESLEQMVDPTIKRTISPKGLSRFADIVSLCIQPEKEFRPPVSEIAESLTSLLQEHRAVRGISGDATEVDPFDRSFRSTNSHFFGSPTVSYLSI
ncbi:hypothetical protein RJ639_040271 [Escallonia herrerae]|uniref:Protein kinase domain-containing protein n=1 Tax=Escallonia herrerae TaxID=1293975 RepID=A0AA88WGP2_9ASTE|nr:hypothetical protein RJ639_040271 [Escallonia herrerae]